VQASHPAAAGELIVVIDDDTLVREGMAGLLEAWGYRVIAARTARAALAQLTEQQQRPDLIICDYKLAGGETGTESIERLRDAFRVPELLISDEIISDAGRTGRPAHAGAFHLLYTPVNPRDLRATLAHIFGEARGPSGE
jgi:CheY-like chemotaxis protein